jgi:hypothetical protein
MPISRSDFEKGGHDTSLLLMEFLSFNPRNAYSVDELVEMMASKGKDLTKKDVERLLSALEYGGRAESKIVDGVAYYRHARVEGQRLI